MLPLWAALQTKCVCSHELSLPKTTPLARETSVQYTRLTGNSTSCLQIGNECIYQVTDELGSSDASSPKRAIIKNEAVIDVASALKTPLGDFVGGSYETLPEASKRLLRHCMSTSFRRVIDCC